MSRDKPFGVEHLQVLIQNNADNIAAAALQLREIARLESVAAEAERRKVDDERTFRGLLFRITSDVLALSQQHDALHGHTQEQAETLTDLAIDIEQLEKKISDMKGSNATAGAMMAAFADSKFVQTIIAGDDEMSLRVLKLIGPRRIAYLQSKLERAAGETVTLDGDGE